MPKWFPSFKRGSATAVAREPTISRAPLSSAAALAGDDDDLVGKNLNCTYVIESVLGEGVMGRVYRARHTRIPSKQFAIKVLRPEFTRNPEVVTRFRRGASTWISSRSPRCGASMRNAPRSRNSSLLTRTHSRISNRREVLRDG